MVISTRPIYQRVLLKVSGEALQGAEGFGIDINMLDRVVQGVKKLVKLGIQIGIVIGGGNLFRGRELAKIGINRVVSDHMGMLATVMNSLAIRDALHRACVNVYLMSAIPLNGICDTYSWEKAISLLHSNCVVIFAAGTGNPFFTTDLAACLRGIEIEAEAVLKATKVDGVFSADPIKHTDAVLYDQLSYQYVLEKELQIMDLAAFALARDHNLPIYIFNISKPNALCRVVMGNKEGTLITHDINRS